MPPSDILLYNSLVALQKKKIKLIASHNSEYRKTLLTEVIHRDTEICLKGPGGKGQFITVSFYNYSEVATCQKL